MSEPIRTRQERLFIESLEEALEAAAMACGGKKNFACVLRPDLADDPDKALRWFLDALNPDRRTEIHADHLRKACRYAREHNCHVLKHWLDDDTGYERTMPAPGKTAAQLLAEQMDHHLREFRRLADEHAAALTASELRAIK